MSDTNEGSSFNCMDELGTSVAAVLVRMNCYFAKNYEQLWTPIPLHRWRIEDLMQERKAQVLIRPPWWGRGSYITLRMQHFHSIGWKFIEGTISIQSSDLPIPEELDESLRRSFSDENLPKEFLYQHYL